MQPEPLGVGRRLVPHFKTLITVLQNRVNPKINAPEVSKGPTKLGRNFQHKYEISEKTNDIQLGN